MKPYYEDDSVVLYLGDCRDFPSFFTGGDVLITDPPYPNNAGHFTEAVEVAREVLSGAHVREAVVFWDELTQPPLPLRLVAVHIWHRTNVNGRPYEPAYHFLAGPPTKKRSEVMAHPAIFDGAGPGCREYAGHPTQKPVSIMRRLIDKTASALVLDPFAGSGSTLIAAKYAGRQAIGVEADERYCEIAANRLAQEVMDFGGAA